MFTRVAANSLKTIGENGQFIAEFSLVTLLVMIPLMAGGVAWFFLEVNRAKCAHQGFIEARKRLIQENRTIHWTQSCGSVREQIHFTRLEDLDQDKRGLDLEDISKEASQLLADASRLSQRLQELVSTALSTRPVLMPDNK